MPTPAVVPAPLPRVAAFERLGFGLFLHYGLYSLMTRGEWVRHHHKVPKDEYAKLADRFTAEKFDAQAIVALAQDAGMKYICLGTRHHDGFSLYDTRGLNPFDAPHSAARRDLIAEYAAACHAAGLPMFLYHTTLDWLVDSFDAPGRWDEYLDYLNRSVEILCTHYGPVAGLWFDGNWARKDRDWKEDALYGMIRRLQPEAIIVNNSSTGALGKVGHPEVDIVTFEQGRPGRIRREGAAKYLAAEMCETFTSHWGIAAQDYSYKSPPELIKTLAGCRRFGANLLLNIGPNPDGSIPAYEAATLRIMGRWIRSCAGSLYAGRPTDLVCRGEDFVLRDGSTYYAYVHHLPINQNMHLAGAEPGHGLKTVAGTLPRVTRVAWTDNDETLRFSQDVAQGMLTFDATANPYGHQAVIRVARIETAG